MNIEKPGSAARIDGHPILRTLVCFPIACFFGALATDIAYTWTADMMWADFSAWLLAAGMLLGVLAAVVGFIDLVVNRHVRTQRQVWPLVIGSFLVLILCLFDNLVHSRDAWTSVVPVGLTLSAVTVVVALITVWVSFTTVIRQSADIRYSGVRQ